MSHQRCAESVAWQVADGEMGAVSFGCVWILAFGLFWQADCLSLLSEGQMGQKGELDTNVSEMFMPGLILSRNCNVLKFVHEG